MTSEQDFPGFWRPLAVQVCTAAVNPLACADLSQLESPVKIKSLLPCK